jgi:hypothetical protein
MSKICTSQMLFYQYRWPSVQTSKEKNQGKTVEILGEKGGQRVEILGE